MYDKPHQFEPLVPASLPGHINDKAAEIVRSATKLAACAHPSVRLMVSRLVRSMCSYYSNKIEGQGTHPLNIEMALKKRFSDKPDIARLQRVAIAHIEAEQELEGNVSKGASALSSRFLVSAHTALYSRLSDGDRVTDDGRIIVPGEVRLEDVKVGEHIPPTAASLPIFLSRMDKVYDRSMGGESKIIAIACAHHRAAWVHPFLDGNGRAIRLQSHCALWELSGGLWSPSRGLARAGANYYSNLHGADSPRRGDLDGRGNLSTSGLIQWIDFFLDICLDQVNFMSRMLDLDNMKRRIDALITFRSKEDKAIRPEAILPLHYLYAAGPVSRGEFAQMTGLGDRTARTLMSKLLATELLVSDTPLGPVRLGLPLDALQFLLPALYPEVELNG